jgi:hypothetical protein
MVGNPEVAGQFAQLTPNPQCAHRGADLYWEVGLWEAVLTPAVVGELIGLSISQV